VHVNVGLVLKFMPNYMLNPLEYPAIPTRDDPTDDVFFWKQGPTRGAGRIQFADWTPVYAEHSRVPNVAAVLRAGTVLQGASPDRAPTPTSRRTWTSCSTSGTCSRHRLRAADPGTGRLTGLDDDIVDQIFAFQINDFNTYTVALQGKRPQPGSAGLALRAIRKPVADAERFDRVWSASRRTTVPTRCALTELRAVRSDHLRTR